MYSPGVLFSMSIFNGSGTERSLYHGLLPGYRTIIRSDEAKTRRRDWLAGGAPVIHSEMP